MILQDHETPFDHSLYAALEDVEKVDARIQSARAKFDSFLRDVDSLAIEMDIKASLGALLLHRHWDCRENELMIETASVENNRPALVTQSQRVDKDSQVNVYPCRWYVDSKGKLSPLEYSEDKGVSLIHERVHVPASFLLEYKGFLDLYGLSDTIGLAILKRESISRTQQEEFVEENYDEKSVVSAQVVSLEKQSKLIETAWPIGKPATLGCRSYCSLRCALKCVMKCKLFCSRYCSHRCQSFCSHSAAGRCYHHRRESESRHGYTHGTTHGTGHGSVHGTSHRYTPVCDPACV